MKKLIFGLFLLNLATPLYADSVTSGVVGLLKPSTNTVDATRSWADKLNVNFDIIAATMNGIIGGTFGSGAEPQSFILFKSTAQAKIFALSVDTATLSNRPTVISIYDSGNNFIGNATTIKFNTNLTPSMVGSTATVNASGSGGGGSGPYPTFFVVPGGNLVSSITFPTSDFRFVFDGVSGGTLTWRGSTGTITGSETFSSTATFQNYVYFGSNTFTLGIASATGVFYSTSGFVGGSSSVTAVTFSFGTGNLGNPAASRFVAQENGDVIYYQNNAIIADFGSGSLAMSKPILGAGGGSGAPDFSFVSQNMGMYSDHIAADRLGLTVGGKPRLIIDNNGSVGTGGKYGSAGFVASSASLANLPLVQFTSDSVRAEWTGSSATTRVDAYFSSPTVITSSLTVTLGTITINGVTYRWAPVNPINGQVLTADGNNNIRWVTPSGGGGGAAIAGYLFVGNQTIAFSTLAFPGATIISDGIGGSSVTYTYTNFNSTSAAAIDFLKGFTSTSDARGNLFVNFRSTTDALFTTFANFRSTTDADLTFLKLFTSTSDARGNTFVNFRSTSDVKFNDVQLATTNIQNFFAGFTSTSNARDNTFVNFRSTTDALFTSFANFRSTTDADLTFLKLFTSTSDAQQNKFVNFRSTTDLVIVTTGNAVGALSVSTSNIQAFFAGFTSTSNARDNVFVNFRSTTDADLTFLKLFTSSSDARGNTFVNFRSTSDTGFAAYVTALSTNINLLSSSPTWTGTHTFDSSMTYVVQAATWGIGAINLIMQSTPSLNTAGNDVMFRDRRSSSTFWVDAANAMSGTGGGTIITGQMGIWTFNGTSFVLASTVSVQSPFETSPVLTSANNVSSFTVLGGTNPYRSISLPAAAWIGIGVSSSNADTNGFFKYSSYTITSRYNNIPSRFMEIYNTTRTMIMSEVEMPMEWDGSSVSITVTWTSTGSTPSNSNIRFCAAAVGFSSAIASNVGDTVFTSSVGVYSTFINAYQVTKTPPMTLTPEGGARGGDLVKFIVFGDDGDGNSTFNGIARLLNVTIFYRQALWDGKPR